MADAAAFEWLCSEIENATSLTSLEARGTVRIALKQAGLDAKSVSAREVAVVILKILPAELVSRGIQDADTLCPALAERIEQADLREATGSDSPATVFERLGG